MTPKAVSDVLDKAPAGPGARQKAGGGVTPHAGPDLPPEPHCSLEDNAAYVELRRLLGHQRGDNLWNDKTERAFARAEAACLVAGSGPDLAEDIRNLERELQDAGNAIRGYEAVHLAPPPEMKQRFLGLAQRLPEAKAELTRRKAIIGAAGTRFAEAVGALSDGLRSAAKVRLGQLAARAVDLVRAAGPSAVYFPDAIDNAVVDLEIEAERLIALAGSFVPSTVAVGWQDFWGPLTEAGVAEPLRGKLKRGRAGQAVA